MKDKNRKQKKRAIFLTISMFFLVASVFTLAIIVFNYTNEKSTEQTRDLLILNRLFDLSHSVEESFEEIFNLNVAKGSNASEFNTEITNFISFVEQNKNIQLTLDAEKMNSTFHLNGVIEVSFENIDISRIRNIDLEESE